MKYFFVLVICFLFDEAFLLECIHKQNALMCIDKGLITFPKSTILNRGITHLDLSNNNIQILYEDALEYFENLINLTLDSNKIWKITNQAFKNQKNLKYLSLRNNALLISNNTFLSSVFIYLKNLECLDLSNNPLGMVPQSFFNNLRNLKELYLEELVKEIKIEDGALSKLYNLKILSMAKNNFVSLPSSMLQEFREMQLETLLLHSNPWACDCRMRWFKRWLIGMKRNKPLENVLKHIHPMICNVPKFLHGKKLFDLTLSKFECKPKILQTGKIVIANNLDNITMSCYFESHPKSYVKWFKNGILIQDHWERIKQTQSVGINFIANLTIFGSRYGIDDGSYICETTNNKGSARINYTLIIKLPSNSHYNIIENKNQQTMLLLIIVATGIITLIILIGIVIYCFYGSDLNIESHFLNNKKSDLLFANSNILMACSSDAMQISPLINYNNKTEEPPEISKWKNPIVGNSESVIKNDSDEEIYFKKENSGNPIVKNFMLNENVFSNQNSDSDNHSCQLSIHEDCPIHGNGNSNNCPVHGSINEISSVDDSSYGWNYVFNNTIKNNYSSKKSFSHTKNIYGSRCFSVESDQITAKEDMLSDGCIFSTKNVSDKHLYSLDNY